MKARASFSIWAYLLSVTVIQREIYATGWSSPELCRCSKTAPRPKDDASADAIVSKFGSNNASTGLSVRITLSKSAC